MPDMPEVAPHSLRRNLIVFPIARLISWLIVGTFGWPRIVGAYRVPRKGPILVLPNHRADVDPMAVQLACPRNLHFMAKSELFEIKVLGRLLRWAGAFPVKRGEPDRGALRHAAEELKLGEAVCVFPEGQLTETGLVQTAKAGVTLIMRLAPCPVICLGVQNTDRIIPYGKLLPRPSSKRVVLTWGEPRTFSRETPTDEILAWIEGQLRELTDETF
jgi:1-acyl-sn-glycerol-3-phosphate acyltransferase